MLSIRRPVPNRRCPSPFGSLCRPSGDVIMTSPIPGRHRRQQAGQQLVDTDGAITWNQRGRCEPSGQGGLGGCGLDLCTHAHQKQWCMCRGGMHAQHLCQGNAEPAEMANQEQPHPDGFRPTAVGSTWDRVAQSRPLRSAPSEFGAACPHPRR